MTGEDFIEDVRAELVKNLGRKKWSRSKKVEWAAMIQMLLNDFKCKLKKTGRWGSNKARLLQHE
jgi:hypothetical protein